MSRQLRTRASRPNYAALFQYGDDDANDAGPSNSAPILDEDDSGSDFAPGDNADEQVGEDEDEFDDDIVAEEEEEEEEGRGDERGQVRQRSESLREGSITVISTPGPKRKNVNAARAKSKAAAVSLAPGLVHPATRHNYTLPSLHHRHRAVPIFNRPSPVERLQRRPTPVRPSPTTTTNSWSYEPIMERVSKAWGFNVGPGPLWELMEDRGWFKESMACGGEENAEEKCRRPRVHEGIKVHRLDFITFEEATLYLPTDDSTTEEGDLRPPPPVPCSFGPYGKQTRVEMNMFEARKIEDFISGSKSHVFNAGAPVWGIAWCPIHPDDRASYGYKQYIAVAPFPSHEHSPSIGVRAQRPSKASFQIWSLSQSLEAMDVDGGTRDDPGEMRCEMVLCIDSGPAFELKWCPLPSNDPYEGQPGIRKLGIVAGTFEDGSVALYTVPDPASVMAIAGNERETSQPIFLNMTEPLLRVELPETLCWALDWANSDVIAVGCTNGSIAVYDVGAALRTDDPSAKKLLPTHYFTVHQSAIRTLAWIRAPVISATGQRIPDNPTVIASGGYDGVECLTDIRELTGNVMNRTRDVVNSLCYSTYCGGPITIDHENIVKSYSLSPSMLGRGHTILEPDGPAWSLAASEYHPQLAVGVTDGSCLTTNTLRATRRGGSVPFFLHKIWQLDYSRKDREWRMLENFLPKEMFDRPTATRSNKIIPVGTGAWPREVAVHRVAWNEGNGLACAPYLASATASGLCRVDWLLGRWHKGRIPYYGVQGIRGEVGDVGDEDENDSD